MKKTMGNIIRVFAVLCLSIPASALVTPNLNSNWNFEKTGGTFDAFGDAVAVDEEGFVYVAGRVPGCSTAIYLAKLDKKAQVIKYQTLSYGACMASEVKGMVARDGGLYMCGIAGGTTGFVKKFLTGDLSLAWSFDSTSVDQITSLCIDPSDGTIWAVGSSTVALHSVIFHMTDGGSGYSNLNSEVIKPDSGRVNYAYAVAVDSTRLAVAGSQENFAFQFPWVYSRDKTGGANPVSTRMDTYAPGSAFYSVALGGGNIYAAASDNFGGGVSLVMFTGTGGVSNNKQIWVAGSAGSWARPSVTVHPTQPIVVVTGGWTNKYITAYDFKLNEKWHVSPFNASWLTGVAFTPGLYGKMYVVGSYFGAWSILKVADYSFEEAGGNPAQRLIIAPNLIELEGTVREASFSMKTGPEQNFKIWVYDAGGNLVKYLLGVAAVGGYGSVVWDMKDLNGDLVAPGAYYAVTDAEGGSRAPFMVVKRRNK